MLPSRNKYSDLERTFKIFLCVHDSYGIKNNQENVQRIIPQDLPRGCDWSISIDTLPCFFMISTSASNHNCSIVSVWTLEVGLILYSRWFMVSWTIPSFIRYQFASYSLECIANSVVLSPHSNHKLSIACVWVLETTFIKILSSIRHQYADGAHEPLAYFLLHYKLSLQ